MSPDPNALLRTEPGAVCGEMMLWNQNAWAHGDNRAAAYRCPNGHVIDPATTHQCPRCGVHDRGPSEAGSGKLECHHCGNRFELGG